MNQTMEKLQWTLQRPDDWGLRYSACLALEAISSTRAIELLRQAREEEPDIVVSTRIALALSNTGEHLPASMSIKDDKMGRDQP